MVSRGNHSVGDAWMTVAAICAIPHALETFAARIVCISINPLAWSITSCPST